MEREDILANPLSKVSFTPILKPGKSKKNENYKSISPINADAKIISNIFENKIQKHMDLGLMKP